MSQDIYEFATKRGIIVGMRIYRRISRGTAISYSPIGALVGGLLGMALLAVVAINVIARINVVVLVGVIAVGAFGLFSVARQRRIDRARHANHIKLDVWTCQLCDRDRAIAVEQLNAYERKALEIRRVAGQR